VSRAGSLVIGSGSSAPAPRRAQATWRANPPGESVRDALDRVPASVPESGSGALVSVFRRQVPSRPGFPLCVASGAQWNGKKLNEMARAVGHRLAAEHRPAVQADKLSDRVAQVVTRLATPKNGPDSALTSRA
jgi:hypothetical protein